MKKYLILLVAIGAVFSLHGQITLVVDSIPVNTPANSDLYVAGDFNGWNPGDPNYKLSENATGDWIITLNLAPGTIQYKFTRGNWTKVEGNANGGQLPNRSLTFQAGDTAYHTIQSWEDLSGSSNSTASQNVHIDSADFPIPQLNRTRRVWVYLPPDYDSTNKDYPVIYMHDGQNVFDAATSFAGEWKVDETLNQLFDDGDEGVIVVAIDNGGSNRLNEYSPWQNSQYGGGEGEKYMAFLKETLKPYIDGKYRTKTEAVNTGLIGSSMGGLISLYGGLKYQNTFQKLGVISPALWFSDSLWTWMDTVKIEQLPKIYFLAGGNEGAQVTNDMQQAYTVLINKGVPADSIHLSIVPGGEHSEWFWAQEFSEVYRFLFQNWLPAGIATGAFQLEFNVYPNPVGEELRIELNVPVDSFLVNIFNIKGQLVYHQKIESSQTIRISDLPTGTYWLWAEVDGKVGMQSIIKK